jgi:predicted enzyme related to lactoylglutathione lyase
VRVLPQHRSVCVSASPIGQLDAKDSTSAKLARAKQNGATVISEPVDAEGVGRFGILRDPLGGMIGVIKPASA